MIVLPLSVEAGELRITVDGIRSAHGTVLIGLYDSPASFGKAVEASAKEGFLIDPDRVRHRGRDYSRSASGPSPRVTGGPWARPGTAGEHRRGHPRVCGGGQ